MPSASQDRPRLSVIVPFYDETAFVQMAISSIIGQGIADIEVILVNDNPVRFHQDYFDRLTLPDNVRVVHQPCNSGLSAARNAGLAVAQGEHIGFLDSDDYYVAGGLAAHLEFARQSRAEITHAQTYITRIGSPQLSILPRDARLFGDTKIRKGLRDCENAQFITSSWSSLYRRDFLDREGLRFDEDQVKFEDRLFVLSAVTTARSIAQLGQPVRVWRRRAGSISTSATDPQIHLLQVQLLEKCMKVVADWTDRTKAPPRFFKRETYNTLARLIWDVDVLPQIAQGTDPFYTDLGHRLTALVQAEGLGHSIFDDPMVSAIDRVGGQTRKGLITRRDFFEIQRCVKLGNFAGAAKVLAQAKPTKARPKPAKTSPRLILHLGMHKTGSTALQRWCEAQADSLARHGVLFPRTGLPDATFTPTIDGGLPGHQSLLAAINKGTEDSIWGDLINEIRQSKARTVILSCENFLMPLREDRDEAMPRLVAQLGRFSNIHPIAFVRRPDVALDRLYREVVAIGSRAGSRSMDEFQNDYSPVLTNLPALFAPFEEAARRPVTLIDYDAARSTDGILHAFLKAAGLADLTKALDAKLKAPVVYQRLDRERVQAARLLNTMLAAQDRRESALRDLFRTTATTAASDDYFMPPEGRNAVLRRFEDISGNWARARGYSPDIAGLCAENLAMPWAPPPGLPPDLHEAVIRSALRSETDTSSQPLPRLPQRPQGQDRPDYAVTIRVRPWLGALLARLGR